MFPFTRALEHLTGLPYPLLHLSNVQRLTPPPEMDQ